ncbi:MAG: hypothetical protein M3N03_09260 [Actinomycetota bacterium]|nr:hypothetical protein [Actinomycetota bacterium]
MRGGTAPWIPGEVRGAENVARRAMSVSQLGLVVRPALINGAAGWVSLLDGEVYAIAALMLQNGRITTMDILLALHASPASTSQTSTPDYDGTRIDQIARAGCGVLLKSIGRKRKKRQVLEPEGPQD